MTDLEMEGASVRVLVVDDDPDMRAAIADYLEREGMPVALAATGAEMLRQLETATFALVILDLRLGQEDGLELLRQVRGKSDVPIIVATGDRRDEFDRVVGLELGADDYILKPFSLRELLARIRTVLRRRKPARGDAKTARVAKSSHFEGWVLDREARRLVDPSGEAVTLTKGEYTMLIVLLDAPGRALSREYLLQATRIHEDVYDRSVDVQILRLRRKLEKDPNAPRFIKTERSLGYVFAVPVDTRF